MKESGFFLHSVLLIKTNILLKLIAKTLKLKVYVPNIKIG